MAEAHLNRDGPTERTAAHARSPAPDRHTPLAPRSDTAAAPRPARRALLAIAALSAGGLAFEVALTRLLSAVLVSDVVGPVLAVAVGGVGLGAAVAAALPAARRPHVAAVAALVGAAAAGLTVPLALLLAPRALAWWTLAPLLLAFGGIGWAVAATFARAGPASAWLYRADLAAAAAAALLTPLALGALGGLHGSVAAASLLALGGLLLVPAEVIAGSGRMALVVGALAALTPVALGASAALQAWGFDPSALGPGKPLAAMLARGAVLEASRWDATARTDLVRTPDGARYLFMDGGAGSLVPDPDPTRWWRDVGAFAFAAGVSERVFLIGSGGGLDVAQARAHRAREVIAVEVNPASVALTRALGPRAADVYEPPTQVVIGDGRKVLAQTPGAFDVITLANVVTNAAERHRLRLTESRVYTLEAFEGYLRRLTPEGRLALTLYDEPTLTRALTTALEALVRSGLAADHGAALAHVLVVLDTSATPPVPMLSVRRTPYTRDEAVAAARIAEARGWALALVPGLLTPPALAPLAAGEGTLAQVIAASADVDLRPTSDARPFFFAFEPGVPRDAQRAGLLALALLLALTLVPPLAAPLAAQRPPLATARRLWSAVGLGLGFMLLELHALGVVQQVLGHPSWSLAATLGAVLAGSALGAGYAARRPGGGVRRPAATAVLAAIAWWSLSGPLVRLLEPWPEAAAAAVALPLLTLLAVPIGVPFTRLLVAWSEAAPGAGPAAAWAGSGLGSLAAGGLAIYAAHTLGTPSLALLALLAYGLAATLHPARWERTLTG